MTSVMTSWYKSTCGENGIQLVLCLCESYLVLSVCKNMPKSQFKVKHEGESKSQFKQCVPPCECYMCAGDTYRFVCGLLGSEACGGGS